MLSCGPVHRSSVGMYIHDDIESECSKIVSANIHVLDPCELFIYSPISTVNPVHNTGCLGFSAGLRLLDSQSTQNEGISLFSIPEDDVVSNPSMTKRTLACTNFGIMKQGFRHSPNHYLRVTALWGNTDSCHWADRWGTWECNLKENFFKKYTTPVDIDNSWPRTTYYCHPGNLGVPRLVMPDRLEFSNENRVQAYSSSEACRLLKNLVIPIHWSHCY